MRLTRLAAPVGFLAALAAAPLLHADNLASDVPADALLFVQWAGTDALGTAYAGSHTKALFDAFQVRKLFALAIAKQQAKETDAQRKAADQAVTDLLSAAAKAPSALYIGPMDVSDPDKPVVKSAFFSKVGRDAAGTLAQELTTAIGQQPHKEGDPPVAAVAVNDFLLVTVGADVDVDKRLAAPQSGDLASTDLYKSTTSKVLDAGAPPAALLYLNGQDALRTLDDAIAAKAPPQQSRNWPMIESALNLEAFQGLALSGNFDGPNWTTKTFLALAENRAGVAAFLDSPPLADKALAVVPSTATWVSVSRFDAPRLLDDIRNAVGNMGGGGGTSGQRKFDMGLQQFFAFTGVDLKKDLFPSLGDAYIFYGTPDAQGHSLNNFTMVSPLKNAQKAESSLSTLETFINSMVQQRDPASKFNFKTEPLPAPNDKTTLHTVVLSTIAPSWTIANGNLYFSLTKEGIIQALADAAKHSPIADNAAYADVRKHIPQPELSRITFMNVPAVLSELHNLMNQAFTRYKTAHQEALGDYEFPPLSAITPLVTSSIVGSWTDAAGWHMQMYGDSPAAGLATPVSVVVSEAARHEHDAPAPPPSTAPAPGALP